MIRVHVVFAVLAVLGLAVAAPYAALACTASPYRRCRRWVLACFGFVMIAVAAIGIVVTGI